MPATSAALLLYRRPTAPVAASGSSPGAGIEVLLGHMGGPFWLRKEAGAWTIPKGELQPDEDPHAAAVREAGEELGIPVESLPDSDVDLGEIRQRAGKRVRAWAREVTWDEVDLAALHSNTAEIEWPPRSGRRIEVPELDRFAWFGIPEARTVIVTAQAELLDRLLTQPGAH